MRAGPSSSFITKSGSILRCEERGSGLPVLCLHGIGGGAWFFTGFAERLQRLENRYRILSIDLPGAAPFTLESIVSDLGDLVRENIREPVVILGHSFGTMIALKAWETWAPGTLRGMLFACGLPKVRANIQDRLSVRASAIRTHGITGWGPKVSPGVFSPKSMAEIPETVALFERRFEEQAPGSYIRAIEALLAADVRSIAPTVTIPCAAIAGAEDSYAPPEAAREFAASLPVPCPVTVIEGAAHMPFFEAPGAFAEAAAEFLHTL